VSDQVHDVVVIGAGMAGLAAAAQVAAAGKDVCVLEASDDVGGRVRTDHVEGFLLDRGFQVLPTAYPEARRRLDFAALDLKLFHPGSMIRTRGRWVVLSDPRRRPQDLGAALRARLVGPRDGVRMSRLLGRIERATPESFFAVPQTTTAEALRAEGLSRRLVDTFLGPFLRGIYLEPDLVTASGMLYWVMRSFSAGPAAVPARGMGAIPAQLASRLPSGSIRLSARVARIEAAGETWIAGLDAGEPVRGRALIVATDQSAAAELLHHGLPGLSPAASRAWNGVTCLYFAATQAPLAGPWLMLAADRDGPVNNAAVMSEAAPKYAPPGSSLISASVIGVPAEGDDELAAAVRTQLAGWFGRVVDDWRLMRVYRIPHAFPFFGPGEASVLGAGAAGRAAQRAPGLCVCGDHTDVPGLNGALASGGRAAAACLAHLSGQPERVAT
jgi:phytoene dehydrogenase-like protein